MPTYKYVDDITLFSITNDAKDSILQEAINKVVSWSSENDMRLNATQTKEMLISFSKSPPEVPHVIVHGSCLERVETTKLLGIQISCDLTWGPHMNTS